MSDTRHGHGLPICDHCSPTAVDALKFRPLSSFMKQYFYSYGEITGMANRGVIHLTSYRNRYYVAIAPEYTNIDPTLLNEL